MEIRYTPYDLLSATERDLLERQYHTVLQVEAAAERLRDACRRSNGTPSEELANELRTSSDEISRLKTEYQATSGTLDQIQGMLEQIISP